MVGHGWVLVTGGEGRWRWVAKGGACAPVPLVAFILREMKQLLLGQRRVEKEDEIVLWKRSVNNKEYSWAAWQTRVCPKGVVTNLK